VAAHVTGKDDVLLRAAPPLKEIEYWPWFLRGEAAGDALEALRRHGRTGRPPGSPRCLERIENRPRRLLRRQKPGLKPEGDK
jgi:putative transposase